MRKIEILAIASLALYAGCVMEYQVPAVQVPTRFEPGDQIEIELAGGERRSGAFKSVAIRGELLTGELASGATISVPTSIVQRAWVRKNSAGGTVLLTVLIIGAVLGSLLLVAVNAGCHPTDPCHMQQQ